MHATECAVTDRCCVVAPLLSVLSRGWIGNCRSTCVCRIYGARNLRVCSLISHTADPCRSEQWTRVRRWEKYLYCYEAVFRPQKCYQRHARPSTPQLVVISTYSCIRHVQDQGEHKIGYARLRDFNSIVAKSLKNALVEMKAGGADEFVLDLRGNSGGAFQSALGVAGLFMNEQPITYVVSVIF